ncbi:MAG: UvrB/UvrC motif-containing protein [bacterium]
MICQVCGQREATFHFKEMINGEVKELHLCEICAKEKGLGETLFMPSLSLSDLMAGLTELEVPRPEEISVSCSHCGLSYGDIKEKGKIGCGLCYQALNEYLTPLLEKIQGKVRHSGKVPRKSKVKDQRESKIYELRKELEILVRKEEYERAAELRDEIRRLEKEK